MNMDLTNVPVYRNHQRANPMSYLPSTFDKAEQSMHDLPLFVHGQEIPNDPSTFIDDQSWLQASQWPHSIGRTVTGVDLFSGCGGLTLGAYEASRRIGKRFQPLLAVDNDQSALNVYGLNFPTSHTQLRDLADDLDLNLARPLNTEELSIRHQFGNVDLLLAGPPCQGHSDLNNHTRRNDPKNDLVRTVIRAIRIFQPNSLLIENVQGITRDKNKNISAVKKHLNSFGYSVDEGLVMATAVGVPQKRRRYFLLGSRTSQPSLRRALTRFRCDERTVAWAIEDIKNEHGTTAFNTPSTHSKDNQERIKTLFEKDCYDLPDTYRPDCHKNKRHSYKSVYGRMYWDRPAPTITTGFGSTGQGRFVHPLFPRTITPHEAARLQTFPDFFSFGSTGRSKLQTLIGNAVPPLLALPLIYELLSLKEN